MALLLKSDIDRHGAWEQALRARDPALEVRTWPEVGDPAGIEAALVWAPPEGVLAGLPNLKLIVSIGAGIDHFKSDPKLPEVPVVRMVEPGLTAGMTEFVVMSVLHHHRFMLDYASQQRAGQWQEIGQVAAAYRRIGFLGLGVLAQDAINKLRAFRFPLAGWSRSPKTLPGVACFHGRDQLPDFLARSDILVCLLPLTPDTEGILDAAAFAALPRGAALINVARGGHQNEDDLLAALDSGQLSGATLDVFQTEPLPADSPLWRHPRVILTPHIASMTIPESAADFVVETIHRMRDGQPLRHVIDWQRGY